MPTVGIVSNNIVSVTDDFVRSVRTIASATDLRTLISNVAREMGFSYYALIHHADLQIPRDDIVDLKDYPSAIVERLFSNRTFRRDPVIRGCIFSGGAFIWSDVPTFMHLDRYDLATLEIGAREGLNQGITVPFHRLGDPIGSCTFAGTRILNRVERYLGSSQLIGVFAFPRLFEQGDR
ncbi:autoinducer binding domain-containing protein [Sphingobium sp. TKS]|uniref:autoinducer binding domain-containing protein n=1 Tax=Sphingobium sp. TKS TaxID=1315974 RepID=UPI000770031B|nr:autoinducer binding domain-containing protein [Sphingobium sp. TKS]AMK21089.1 LuxR-family transcriptional regulator [Sphingobium sp. TKS]